MAEGDGAQRFSISATNPNESIGGGGCLCSEQKCEDRGGPYAVFHGTEMDNNLSPHVVLCAPCAGVFVTAVLEDAETITAGEPVPVLDAEAELVEVVQVDAPESPSAVGEYPIIPGTFDLDVPDDEPII